MNHIPTIGPLQPINPQMQMAISVLQLVVLVIGVGGVFVTLGRKDAILERQDRDLTELRQISMDLVKAQVLGATNDSRHHDAIGALGIRLERLEQRR